MAEPKPQYSLEFVLKYDQGSITFTASTDNPFIVLRSLREILNLSSSTVSDRVYNHTEVTVDLYKEGQPLDLMVLLEDGRRYYKKE